MIKKEVTKIKKEVTKTEKEDQVEIISKEVTKTYYVFEKEDLEKVVSKFFGKPVKLSEMIVELADMIDIETEAITGTFLTIDIEGEEDFFSFYDYEKKGFNLCEDLGIEEAGYFSRFEQERKPSVNKFFAFHVSEFKSFDRYEDSSD